MDDDDAFLYGDASAGGDAEAGGDAGAAAAPGAVPAAASGAAADPVLADDGDGDGNDDAGSSAMEESSDDSSDEDVEIVMDAPDAAGARPAAAGGALVPSNNEPIQPQLLRAHIPGGAPGGMGLSVGAGSGSGAGADSASPQRKQPSTSDPSPHYPALFFALGFLFLSVCSLGWEEQEKREEWKREALFVLCSTLVCTR